MARAGGGVPKVLQAVALTETGRRGTAGCGHGLGDQPGGGGWSSRPSGDHRPSRRSCNRRAHQLRCRLRSRSAILAGQCLSLARDVRPGIHRDLCRAVLLHNLWGARQLVRRPAPYHSAEPGRRPRSIASASTGAGRDQPGLCPIPRTLIATARAHPAEQPHPARREASAARGAEAIAKAPAARPGDGLDRHRAQPTRWRQRRVTHGTPLLTRARPARQAKPLLTRTGGRVVLSVATTACTRRAVLGPHALPADGDARDGADGDRRDDDPADADLRARYGARGQLRRGP